jgi:hypothetical protein
MAKKEKTAVAYLHQQLLLAFGDELKDLRGLFVIAKEVEEKQIKNAWLSAWKDSMVNPLSDEHYKELADEYYNEKYEN